MPETDAVSKTMESMIQLDGAGLILATSFGYYTPFVVRTADGWRVAAAHVSIIDDSG